MVIKSRLNVPSGKMVLANDLRDLFVVVGSFDIMTEKGLKQTAEAYEKMGMMHFFVGNTCPGVHQLDNKTLEIRLFPSPDEKDFYFYDVFDEDAYEKEVERLENVESKTCVDSICTDLWWYCAVDYDEFVRHLKHFYSDDSDDSDKQRSRSSDPKIELESCIVIDVVPGVYEFEHSTDEQTVLTSIKWIKNPTSGKDYLSKYLSQSYTAGQIIYEAIESFPTLYKIISQESEKGPDRFGDIIDLVSSGKKVSDIEWGELSDLILNPTKKLKGISFESLTDEEKKDSIQRVAEHILFCGGNGYHWHPNGWGSSTAGLSTDLPDIEIPEFDKRYDWGGSFSQYNGKINFNESFRKLAFECLYSILVYGNSSTYLKEDESKKEAMEYLKKLAKRYSSDVPQKCKKLLDLDGK